MLLTQEQNNRLPIPTKEEWSKTHSIDLSGKDFTNTPLNITRKIERAQSFDKDCIINAKIRDGKFNNDNDTYSL